MASAKVTNDEDRAMSSTGNNEERILDADLSEEIRLFLIGKTGVGKSATANTILQRKRFASKMSSESDTKLCQFDTVIMDGKHFLVLDTPGLFDTRWPEEKCKQEILKCLAITAPGPHAIIYVLSSGRFTKEDADTAEKLERLFPKMFKNAIIVFTGLDILEEEGTQFTDIYEKNDCLRTFVEKFKDRVFPINNKAKGKEAEDMMDRFYKMVIKLKNETSYYTNELLSATEKEIKAAQVTINPKETIKSRMAARHNILNGGELYKHLKLAMGRGVNVLFLEMMRGFLIEIDVTCSVL